MTFSAAGISVAAAFAVVPIQARHKKTPTHGVETKETCNIIDGTDEPDTLDEPYEDEECAGR